MQVKQLMKKIFLSLICLICLAQSACERDDICAETTVTTPLLVIDFFDADDPSSEKIPSNLVITADGQEQNEDGEVQAIIISATSSIAIPLRTDQDITSFTFTVNESDDDDNENENSDIITFNYTRTEDFVSSACGFRITYDGLQETLDSADDGPWINNVEISNPIVEDETTTHVTIFH